ncbi:MAG TPA: MBL fold metallo-hydrolase [Acidimicrobiales bacterium]|nr:MBL fold metallo-hydrolase [Acidimicrobiales bacterium]
MEITLVGHASVLIEAGPVRLLSDPWYVGTAFNESWTLHPQPEVPDDLFDGVTHLWISHEHPDHLSIPTLRSIPAERRAEMTLLYQRHWSGTVFDWVSGLGFGRAVEMRHGDEHDLGGGVRARLFQVRHEDAALAVHHDGATVFNLNDGKPSTATLRRLRQRIGPIDVLLTQFSPAGWPGNPDDDDRLAATSAKALAQVVRQADVLGPSYVVPFASFVRFSHEESAFMNRVINRMDRVRDALGPERTAAMSSGERLRVGDTPAGSDAAVERYITAVDAIADLPLTSHEPVPFDDVVDAAQGHVENLRRDYHATLLRRLGPVTFDLTDLGRSLTLDIGAGAVAEGSPEQAPGRINTSSQAAWYTFAHRWGVPTLLISGRFRLPDGDRVFRRYKELGSAWSGGFHTHGLLGALASPRGRDLVTRRWRDLRDLVPGGS